MVASHIGWPGSGDQPMTLAAWQKDYAWADKEARTHAGGLGRRGGADRSKLFINDHESPVTIPLDAPYLDLDGKPVGDHIALAPFSSRILIRAEAAR